MAFRSCISTGKLKQLVVVVVVFFSGFMKSSDAPSWQWLQKRGLVNTSAATRTLGLATQVTRLILQPKLTNRRKGISFSTNLESCRRFVNKIRWGIRRKTISNKLHTLTMSPLEKKGIKRGSNLKRIRIKNGR